MNKFLKSWIITAIFIFSLAIAFYIFLFEIGEVNIKHIANKMFQSQKMLFLSGIGQETFDYKKELHLKYQPEVVALGSSRALEARKEFFSSSFLNWGGASGALPDIAATINFIVQQKIKPKVALIFVDVWWFNPAAHQNTVGTQIPPTFPTLPSFSLYEAAIHAIMERSNNLHAIIDADDRLGLGAKYINGGFDAYGSMFYVGCTTDKSDYYDKQFKFSVEQIKVGNSPFLFGNNASDSAINRFLFLVHELEKKWHTPHFIISSIRFKSAYTNTTGT